MKKKLVVMGLLLCIILSACTNNGTDSADSDGEYYDWNNGYCIDCNAKLEFTGCGNKYHYTCPECGKTFTFNSVQSYK